MFPYKSPPPHLKNGICLIYLKYFLIKQIYLPESNIVSVLSVIFIFIKVVYGYLNLNKWMSLDMFRIYFCFDQVVKNSLQRSIIEVGSVSRNIKLSPLK